MTNQEYYKEYQDEQGRTYFIARFREKICEGSTAFLSVPMWEYGVRINGRCITYAKGLRSRPNLKRLGLI